MMEQQSRLSEDPHTHRQARLASDELSDEALEHVVGGLARTRYDELPVLPPITAFDVPVAADLPGLLT